MRSALPVIGLVIGLWAVLPPYTGPELATEMRVEIADHVVPSILVLILSVVTLAMQRRRAVVGSFFLLAGLGVLLAGFWMVATHVPLVAQARRGEVTGGVAAYHTAPGVAVTLLGVAWAALHWDDGAAEPES